MSQTTDNPSHALSEQFKQACQLYQADKLTEAASAYSALLKQFPYHAESHYNLATILTRLADWDNAITHYRYALEYQGDVPQIHYNLSIALLNAKRLPQAVQHLTIAASKMPRHFDVQHLLACTLLHQGENEEALNYFKQAYGLNSKDPQLNLNMGICYLGLQRYPEASTYFNAALADSDTAFQAYYNLGIVHARQNNYQGAINHWQRAHALRSNHFDPVYQLALAYKQLQNWPKAIAYCDLALSIRPQDPTLTYLKTAMMQQTPLAQAPEDYVRTLFDQYAPYYDQHLTETLAYALPDALHAAIREVIPQTHLPLARVVDLGCGSGLCGSWARSMAEQLIGVDISKQMLAKAKARQCYDELCEAAIESWLADNTESADLIFAADVWVYFGDLSSLFKLIHRRLAKGGWFAFSIELAKTTQPTYQLLPTGRFSHSGSYIQRLAHTYGFKSCLEKDLVIRKEAANDVRGRLYVLETLE